MIIRRTIEGNRRYVERKMVSGRRNFRPEVCRDLEPKNWIVAGGD